MLPTREPVEVSGGLPDPARCASLDEFVGQLRRLKLWAGDPSYESIKDRVNAVWSAAGRPAAELTGKSTVADCFRTGRQRLNTDLVLAVVEVLHPDGGYLALWRQALRVVVDGVSAALQVRVLDDLPQDVSGFTGRGEELDRIRSAAQRGQRVVTISGMPGVGKTRLAVHAGRLLADEQLFDRVLFVNLRGFHPDPGQPPADPGAVLEAFLRLLGVPAQQISHDLPARVAAYHDRLTGIRALVVLDNAADAEQIRVLAADSPGCLTLVTSRRRLTGLPDAARLGVDVFTPQQAEGFLQQAVQAIPVGTDSQALPRIARRCGYLPLALGLVAGHIRGLPGWTLTDHADRLDKRHHERRLDTAVELALDLSYRHLPPAEQQLLRLLALHPGHDVNGYAAAALTATGLAAVRRQLRRLCLDNLLQTLSADRYTFHDLVRAYATGRAGDDEPPSAQHAALTRLFDHYLATAATAMDTLYPAEVHRRPRIPSSGTPMPDLTDPDTALAWLDTERPTLVAVAAHTATHGWPTHTTRLSTTLYRYLTGGHHTDALTVHGHAHAATQRIDDPAGKAHVLANLGAAHLRLGRHEQAADHLRQALHLFRQTRDWAGQARTLNNLGIIEKLLGRYQSAADHHEQALTLYRQTGDRTGEARALSNLGNLEEQLGRYQPAADHHEQALTLFRTTGDRTGEAWVLDSLGTLHTRLGRPGQATEHYQQALAIHRETGGRNGEAWALNGLGEAAHTAGRPADALAHHTAAHTIAADVDDRYQQARAHTGLGHTYRALNDPVHAGRHYQQALTLYTDLGLPDADQIKAHLTAITASPGPS
jgi:tetratricopeptide (TPR) repeat protein